MLIKSFGVNSGQQSISSPLFVDLFESSISGCPIVSYRLVQENDKGGYEEYEGTELEMDENDFTVYIDTDFEADFVAYIEASSLDSDSVAYLPL